VSGGQLQSPQVMLKGISNYLSVAAHFFMASILKISKYRVYITYKIAN